MGSGGGGSVGGGGEVDVSCLGGTAGVGEDCWGEADISGGAGGGRGLGVGDACWGSGIGARDFGRL